LEIKKGGKMKNIIVTGGLGLIGYNLVQRLVNEYGKNLNLLIVDLKLKSPFSFFKDELYYNVLENMIEKIKNNANVTFNTDLNEYIIEDTFGDESIHEVYHLGAIADPTLFEIKDYVWEWNVISTKRYLDIFNKIPNKIHKFFFASTSEVYGYIPNNYKVNEKSPLFLDTFKQREIYALSKLLGENLVINHLKNAYKKIIGRIFNTYGFSYYQDNRLIQNLLKWAYDEDYIFTLNIPNATRSFCHVDDLVTEILLLMENDTILTEELIVNIGNPYEHYRIADVVEIFKEIFGVNKKFLYKTSDYEKLNQEPIYRDFEMKTFEYYCDYKPQITLEEGLKRLKEQYDVLV
jgi:UDP-glucuronate decarboxylase